MSERQKSGESFLERWSRQKIEAERGAPETAAAREPTPDDAALPERPGGSANTAPVSKAEPEFDLASLPSLNSITAATDIRAFLAPGVPNQLTRAALRRAWAVDPAIRDFVGLAENAWDFTAPDAIAGFGDLPPGYDVKKLVAHILGGREKETVTPSQPAEPRKTAAASNPEETASPATADAAPAKEAGQDLSRPADGTERVKLAAAQPRDGFVQREDSDTAVHKDHSSITAAQGKSRRHHGGALPQ